jgi:eukaryotic-like serine/threonine-protein kinase
MKISPVGLEVLDFDFEFSTVEIGGEKISLKSQPLSLWSLLSNNFNYFNFPQPIPSEIKVNTHSGKAQYFLEDLGNSVILEMVKIPGGEFFMGSEKPEGWKNEYPRHKVKINPFFLGKFTITSKQWRAVANLPEINCCLNSTKTQLSNHPVVGITWDEAAEFCLRLSEKTGRNYRLPSEAEWEYACRAGTTTPFHFGETIIPDLVNYLGKPQAFQGTKSVGSVANAFGLYDMHGNVWEWCADNYHDDYQGAPTDGSAWIDLNIYERIVRGGSWRKNLQDCRCASRESFSPLFAKNDTGFRIAVSVN